MKRIKNMKRKQLYLGISLVFVCIVSPGIVSGYPIGLQNATATFSQVNNTPDKTIDGFNGPTGWAIQDANNETKSETAVWETTTDLINPGSIKLEMIHGWSQLVLGHYRWSVTGDDRSTFADGLGTGGDVTANWTYLADPTFDHVGENPSPTFTELLDSSILLSGNTGSGWYSVTYNTVPLTTITGIRLEAMEHSSFPTNGPGTSPTGNFYLHELNVSATEAEPVPEPATIALLGIGLAGLAGGAVRRRFKKQK